MDPTCGEIFPQGKRFFDGFGRTMQDSVLRPDNTWVDRYSAFSISGRHLRDSEWTPSGGAVHYTEYQDFDPLGRPGKIFTPDRPPAQFPDKFTKLTYSGERQLDREVWIATALDGTETQLKTTYIWDAFGRLKSVTEPSGAAFTPVTTNYGYDVGDRLVSVSTPTGAASTQDRLFKYDHRGFLKFETLPEKDVFDTNPDPNIVENFSVAYTYDARGNVTSIQDGSVQDWQKLSYDKAERLLEVRDGASTPADRLLKRFTYDLGSSGLALSKVTKTERWNYFDFLAQTALITQSLAYQGVEGRISSRTTSMSVNGVARESFAQGFTWNRSGELVAQSYPVCSGGGCPAGGQTPRSTTNTFSRGFLTGASYNGSSVATLAYFPDGMLNEVRHDNSTVASQKTKMVIAEDSSGMPRPGDMSYYTGTTPIWQFGTFAYDGAGNLKSQANSGGASLYRYDGVSRLAEAQLGFGGGPYRQSYVYDRFGNINSISTQVGSGGASTVNTPTTITSNRLTNGFYDPAGNMKSYIGSAQEYFYDAFGLTYRAVKGLQGWIYVYSADDERIWNYQIAGGTSSYFTLRGLDGSVMRETALHLGGNSFTDYVYGAGLLAKFDASLARTDYHVDHLGSPRIAAGLTGTVQRFYMYYPYGQEFNAPGTADTFRLRFTGHERDLLNTASAADDNEYHHARNFSLTTARYHSPDPVRGNPFAPQRWNLFSYVGGNPMNRVDPYGLDWCTPIKDEHGDIIGIEGCGDSIDIHAGPAGPVGGNPGGTPDPRSPHREDHVGTNREKENPCRGTTWGITVSAAGVFGFDGARPVLAVYGFNIQFLPGAVGIFEIGTHREDPISGAAFGWSITSNFGVGSGSFSGPFLESAAGLGVFAAGAYSSPSGLSLSSWQGLSAGYSGGLPVGQVTSTNYYNPLFVFGPNSEACSK